MPPKGIININSSTGFIQLYDFDEIKKREKFVSIFDPKGKELVKVIGSYEFDEEIHCSLTDCNQPHKKGFIVLTSTEEETNIGNNCGERIFGHIHFSTLRKSYKTELEIENNLNIISNSRDNLDKWYEQLIFHYNKSGNNARWAWETLTRIFSPSVIGQFAYKELDRMKRTLDGKVTVDRVATTKEAEIFKAQGKKTPYFVEITLGEVKYISVLSQSDELKRLVLDDIRDTLRLIENIDLNNPTRDYKKLSEIAKRANNIESNFKRINFIVENTKKFFVKQNFDPLYSKLVDYYAGSDKNVNINRLSNFINSLKNQEE